MAPMLGIWQGTNKVLLFVKKLLIGKRDLPCAPLGGKGTSYVDIYFCGRFSYVGYSFKSVTGYPQLPRKAECILGFCGHALFSH